MTGDVFLLMPILMPMLFAVLTWAAGLVSAKARDITAVASYSLFGLIALVAIVQFSSAEATLSIPGLAAFCVTLRLDGFRRVYLGVIALMWLVTGVFSIEYLSHGRRQGRYHLFSLLTLSALCGMFLADDLMTAYLFFEMLSFTSYVWVAHEETQGALRAANTYLAIAVIGGLVALMGLFLMYDRLGTLSIPALSKAVSLCKDMPALYTAGGCLLFGFGAKAGMFPLHIWLPKAHPVAPAPASALLSGVLTKAGIFGIAAVSVNVFWGDAAWGWALMIPATVTMVLGAVMALLSIDIKRILACSSMSQIGFILVGLACSEILGGENALAMRGVLTHMVNHSLFKLILFVCAGAVAMGAHTLDLNQARGFGRRKPLLKAVFLSGALGIAGIPLFSGYISKTLLHEGIVESMELLNASVGAIWAMQAVEWLFLISGGLTIAYMAKLYTALFVEQHPTRQKEWDLNKRSMSLPSGVLMGVCALLPPLMGVLPGFTLDKFADASADFFHSGALSATVAYFTWGNLQGALISLSIGALVYLLIVRRLLMRDGSYVDIVPKGFDLENAVYRPVLLGFLPQVLGRVSALFGENKLLKPLCAFVVNALAVISRACSDLMDAMVLLLRKTLFRESKPRPENTLTERPLYRFGLLLGKLHAGWSVPREKRFAKRLLRVEETAAQTARKIAGGLSFALLMACIGICLVLIFILIVF